MKSKFYLWEILLMVSSMWLDIAKQLQHKQGNTDELARWAELSLPELHQQLLSGAEYQAHLSQAQTTPLKRYSESMPLFENSQIKASLVALEKGRPLPLHDHPGASGIMLVIHGDVCVYHCNADQAQQGKPLSLDVVEITNLQEGKTSWFTDSLKNIHSVNALSQRAVLLVVHAPKFQAQQQSYYFPLTSSMQAGTRIHAQRINAHAFSSIGKKSSSLQQLANNQSH